MSTIQVAIDGPAGAGKSTISKLAAKDLGFVYVDTGALYRTVGLFAKRNGIALDEASKVTRLLPEANISIRYGASAPWVQVGTIFSSLMLFIQHLYSYVVVVIVGIDLSSFTPQFILCSALYAVCVVLSIVNIYLKQEKEAK